MEHLFALVLGLGLPSFSLPEPIQIVFAINTLAAVFSAINVLVQTNPVYSALFLVGNFFCLAVYYLLLDAQFLAAVQIIVYAGAIMVLFLFVVTLLSPGREERENDRLRALQIPSTVLALILGLSIAGALFLNEIKGTANTNPNAFPQGLGTVQTVGDQLFRYFLFPFEVTSLLLLVAMLGAIVLAKRKID